MLITDLNMPVKDGLQLISEVKAIEQYKRIPIILLTTGRNADKLQQAEKMMITAFMNKPFELDKFRKIVTKCLTQSMVSPFTNTSGMIFLGRRNTTLPNAVIKHCG